MKESAMSSSYYGEGYWEKAEGSNYRNYGDDPGWAIIAEGISYLSRGDGKIYEVACAKGYLVDWLVKFGLDAYGIDISEYAISKAPESVSGRVSVANATNLPWEDNTADCVVSMEFFEHVPEDEIEQVLSEKMRVLRSGGMMLMKINIDDHHSSGEDDNDHSHFTIKPRIWWENIFAGNGLIHNKQIENMFDSAFANRDWHGRFFVWTKA